jgi:hypothetical protein
LKLLHKVTSTLGLILFSTAMIPAQDLSKYRSFSFGSSVADISKRVDTRSNEPSLIHRSPVLIQELIWWPVAASGSSRPPEAIEQVRLSFCNQELYKIVATYDEMAIKGMTADDMVEAISATYGTATRFADDPSVAAPVTFSSVDVQLALWENAEYSIVLSHSPLSSSFQLTLMSKARNAQAEAGIAEDVRQETEGAPQRETARVKKEADDLEAIRQANLKSFRP